MPHENPKWVRSWVGPFLAEHTDRVKRSDWPAFERPDAGGGPAEIDPYWDAWIWSFITRGGVTHEAATRASRLVAADPPEYLDKQLKGLVEALSRVEAEDRADASAGTQDEARARSRDCLDCEGSGFARRYAHAEIEGELVTAGGVPVPVGGPVVMFCGCPLGKFLAMANRPSGSPRPCRTIDQRPNLRLDDVPWSDAPDNKYRHHPDDWEDAHGDLDGVPASDRGAY